VIFRYITFSWAEGVAQVVECLPGKPKVLSPKPQYHQKQKKKISRAIISFPNGGGAEVSRVPALQAQSPEFNTSPPTTHTKKPL
jgi:hypothetical protein